ncbi:MAG: ATP-dependent Clp protease ATP-binding subunit [Candidatus Levybacteria bacterium]|nr:ATP-dependent Clp protease ATP-binding subunit [Candidatus Levybacteria bacterium]
MFVKAFRFFALLFLTIVLFYVRNDLFLFRIILSFYVLYLVNEIFVHFKINKSSPLNTVSIDSNLPQLAILFNVRYLLSIKNNNFFIEKLIKQKDVAFFIAKIDGFDSSSAQVNVIGLLNRARSLAQICKGTYITAADIFAAYLLLTESESHLLEQKELTENDILEILLWCREKYNLDKVNFINMHFTGAGVFDFFIYGWNTQLKEFSFDLTYSLIGKNTSPIVGREKEFSQMVGILSKNSTNNLLIIGEPGVGKSSLVSFLALEAYRNTRFILHNTVVYELLVDRLLAGVSDAGELETRLGLLLSEIEHIGNAVLFIQNMENIFGAGGFGFDMSGILFSYLKNGKVQIIGTTTPSFYKSVIEKKSSIMSLFELLRLYEPDRDVSLRMIAAHVDNIEREYNVSISYKAIHETLELAFSFLPETFLPGKAILLLHDVSSRVRLAGRNRVEKEDVIQFVQEKTNILLERPDIDEKKVLLSLEQELHKRIIGQDEAVIAISKAIRRLRSGFSQNKRPISTFLFLGPTGVGKTETAKALSQIYFGDEANMIRLDMSEYQTQNEVDRLLGGVPGGIEIENSLPEQVRLHPFSLILLDEFEKAHPHILDIFLQIFEDARLTDNSGRTVSFKNTIIIATSNAGSESIREMMHEKKDPASLKNILVEALLRDGVFKPELLNRFDDVIIFTPLSSIEAAEIAKLILALSLKSLEDDQIYITFDDKVKNKIVQESFDEEAGARNMRRYVGSTIEDYLSRLILEDKLKKGAHATLTVDENNNFVLQ